MKKILLVTYGGGHQNIIDPIAKHLGGDCDTHFTILAMTTAYSGLVDQYPKGTVKRVSDYIFLFDDIIEYVFKYGIELLAENYDVHAGLSKLDVICYLGLSFFDLVQRCGKKCAYKLYQQKKRQAFLPVSVMKRIISFEDSDVVVATTSPRFEQASIIAGNELGLQTLQVLDLFGEVYPLPEAKNIVTMAEQVSENLRSQGLRDRTFYEYGQPAIEQTALAVAALSSEEIAKRVNLKLKGRTLLFATQKLSRVNEHFEIVGDLDYCEVYDSLFDGLELLRERYDLSILIRLHPNENLADYQKYFDRYDQFYYANQRLSLEESLSLADMVLVKTSTVALQASVCNKAVFTYMHESEKNYSVPMFKASPFIFSYGIGATLVSIEEYIRALPCKDAGGSSCPIFPAGSAEKISSLIMRLADDIPVAPVEF